MKLKISHLTSVNNPVNIDLSVAYSCSILAREW